MAVAHGCHSSVHSHAPTSCLSVCKAPLGVVICPPPPGRIPCAVCCVALRHARLHSKELEGAAAAVQKQLEELRKAQQQLEADKAAAVRTARVLRHRHASMCARVCAHACVGPRVRRRYSLGQAARWYGKG